MANEDVAELSQPCVGSLDAPATLASSELSAPPPSLAPAMSAVPVMRNDQVGAARGE